MVKLYKRDLYCIVRRHIPEATKQQSKEIVKDIFFEIENSLLRKEDVVLRGFGTLFVVPIGKRKMPNFFGRGKDVVLDGYDKVHFKISRTFKEELNSK